MNRRLLLPLLLLLLLPACSRDTPSLQPLTPGAVILAFGDSLTYGTGVDSESSYPAQLAKLSGHEVINAGIPGEQSQSGLARLPGELDEYRPALLILCHGGNDMLRRRPMAAMQSNLEQMIALARKRGVQVVMLGVPQPALFGLESAPTYIEVAKKMGVPMEESVIPEVLADKGLKSDQIHPNAAGYQKIAEAVYRLLRREGAL